MRFRKSFRKSARRSWKRGRVKKHYWVQRGGIRL